MIKNNNINELISLYLPKELLPYIYDHGENLVRIYHYNRGTLLHELKAHYAGAKRSGMSFLGLEDSINELEKYNDQLASVIAGRNKEFAFRVFLNDTREKLIGFTIIPRRKYSEEEIEYMRNTYGIKGDPPS